MLYQTYIQMRSEMVEQGGLVQYLGERMQDLLENTRMIEIDEYTADV
jgi:hypothetical protein